LALKFAPAGEGAKQGARVMKIKELLRVTVLGKLAVQQHATRMQLPRSKKTRALLAYLAVTGRPQSRDHLCAMFWNIPDDPRAALRWSLTHLRPIIDGPGCRRILADRETVALDLDNVAVDIVSVRNATRQGVNSLSTDALCRAAEQLEGEFLERLDLPDCQEFQSWCTAQREEARRLRVRVLTALVARLEGTPDDALPHARALSRLEPANEGAQATLVRLLRTTGRRREADEHCRRTQKQLAEFNVALTGLLRQAEQAGADDRKAFATLEKQLRGSPPAHEVRFCRTSDNVRIAYASVGKGPPVVWAAHWLSHLSFSWKSPVWRHWTEEFAKDHCFIHYDERGSGLSDWDDPELSIDAFVRDLEAVVDTLGLDRFALIGSSKGGPTSIAYAARHPERVSQLVLYGTFAQGWRINANRSDIERREAIIALMRQGWAQDNPAFRQILTTLFLPDATLEEMGWLNDLQRLSASTENAVELMRSLGELNVVDLLPDISAPTLILHCRDDAAVGFEKGRLIASRIPAARFVTLDSHNHILLPRDPAWAEFVGEVRRFLRGDTRVSPRNQQTTSAARH
jgi:DNA-binding SARP family transcriptional activator/pimeloyl-ACP methyl ester carboxylesterase